MPLVLGVDSSTQSTKVEIRDADDGRLVGTGRVAHPVTQPPRSEQDPEVWWTALRAAVVGAGKSADLSAVAAMSVAGQQHGMVVLDAGGRPLRPAKLWNDTESASESAELITALGAEGWAAAVGSVPLAAFTITKLVWLARHEPATFDRVSSVLLPHDVLTFRLTGRRATDRGDASGTGYWSPAGAMWRTDLLDRFVGGVDWTSRLPEVLGPTDAAGAVAPGASEALGVAPSTIVGPGTGDNMAAALGIGLGAGDACVSLGTSGTVFGHSLEPVADPTGAVAGFADAAGAFLPLVCTLNATRVTDAVARLLGVDEAELDDLASAAGAAGTGGVVVVPYLDGERTPNRPDATGTITGLRSDVSRPQLARAAFEGVVCGLLDGLDALDGCLSRPAERLVVVGGGARSRTYPQVLADLSRRPVTVLDGERVATGACVQAAALLHGRSIGEVQTSWGLGKGRAVEPTTPQVDATGIRSRYREQAAMERPTVTIR